MNGKAQRPILRVGLTGGIASGKTTVARIMAELGAFVLDADRLAHELMAPGGRAYDRVVEHFGREILDPAEKIDRTLLARRVFADSDARQALNTIVHPEVRKEALRRIADYLLDGRSNIAVFEAALIVESGAHHEYDRLVVARCSWESQIRRLLVRDSLSADAAEARLAAQAPLEAKLAVADYVIDTERTLRETREQTEQVYTRLLEDFEEKFGAP